MISIDWGTQIIFVPKSYTQFVSTGTFEIRQLDINQFRLDLKALEYGVEGMPHLRTHSHNTTVTVGGVQLARVVTIINGYSITFEDGPYAVNLVGANSNIADVVNLNQVQIRSANSAGLTFSEEINAQSFLGRVWISNSADHPNEGQPGVQFPRGTPTSPVDNYADAYFIAQNRNFHEFNLDGELIFTGTTYTETDVTGGTITYVGRTDLTHEVWHGFSPYASDIVSPFCSDGNSYLDGSCVGGATRNPSFPGSPPTGGFTDNRRTAIRNSSFYKMGVSGYYTGFANFYDCLIGIDDGVPFFDGFNGEMDNCGIGGDVIICNSVRDVDTIEFRNCYDITPTSTAPSFDFTQMDNSVARFSGWHGAMRIKGLKTNDDLTIGVDSGYIKIDLDTCTGGTIHIRGLCHIDLCTSGFTNCNSLDLQSLGGFQDGGLTGLTLDTQAALDPNVILANLPGLISNQTWSTISSSPNPGTYGELVNLILSNSDTAQHIQNVHTQLLKNNSK
jgi:hypothetical protein